MSTSSHGIGLGLPLLDSAGETALAPRPAGVMRRTTSISTTSGRRAMPPSRERIQRLVDALALAEDAAGGTASTPGSSGACAEGSVSGTKRSTGGSGSPMHRLASELREALRFAVARGDVGLLGWLMALQGRAATALDAQARLLVDADGNGLISIALIAAAGIDSAGAGGARASGMSADDTADGAIGTQAAAGGKKMEDREEVVRMCVRRWGLLETQGAGGGAAWQPLHFAALLSSPPLVSFLLTQGAAPHGTTLKGLTPYDLVADMAANQRDEVAALLQGSMLGEIEDGRVDPPREPASHSGSTPGGAFDAESRFASSVGGGEATPTAEGAGLSARRQRMLERHRGNKMRRAAREADAADRRARQDARDGGVARALGAVGLGSAVPFVVADFERARREARAHEGGEAQGGVVLDNDADELSDSASEDEDEGGGASADEHEAHRFGGLGGIRETEDDAMFDDIDGEDAGGAERKPLHLSTDIDDASMLVFNLDQLDVHLDVFVHAYEPQCFPLTRRTVPANAIYLYARFALHRCNADWLAAVIQEALYSVDQVCEKQAGNLAYLAFWLYNTTILLHLVQSDPVMLDVCEELGLCVEVEETLNRIAVHIIRLVELQMDKLIDSSLLDYENIDDFADVRYDDEWAILRSLKSRPKKASSTFVADVFRQAHTSPSTSPLRGTVPRGSDPPTPSRLGRPASTAELGSSGAAHSVLSRLTSGEPDDSSPRRMTDLLSAALLVLQLYDVNPAITVQIFSQIFLWMASEMFNRIIAQGKKYLCRIKAMQIKLNISVLEDWLRANALPPHIFSRHFERVLQLLQWLQCSSQLRDFDMLIATMQNLQSLNPLQMRRAVKDYRFEVNESRMSEECAQYLNQLIRDYERRRLRLGFEALDREVDQRRTASDATSIASDPPSTAAPGTAIDALFSPDAGLQEYLPPGAPASIGELENSRLMLPLLLPDNDYLGAAPPAGEACRNVLPLSDTDTAATSRPASRASFSSSRPLCWRIQQIKRLQKLPDDFIDWLTKAQREADGRLRPNRTRPAAGSYPADVGSITAAAHAMTQASPVENGRKPSAHIHHRRPAHKPPADDFKENAERDRPRSVPVASHDNRRKSPLLSAEGTQVYPSSPQQPLSAPPHLRQQAQRSSSPKSLRHDASPTVSTIPRWWKPRNRIASDVSMSASEASEDDHATPTVAGVDKF